MEGLRRIAAAEKNIVLSPAGTAAALWLEKEYGTPWEYGVPDILTDRILEKLSGQNTHENLFGRNILVVHQQVLAGALADALRRQGLRADAASFFMMHRACMAAGDVRLREEADLRAIVQERGYDTVLADQALAPLLAGLPVRLLHLPHFAVSGNP